MRDDLRHDVLHRIQSDFGLKHRAPTKYMRGGNLPEVQQEGALHAL